MAEVKSSKIKEYLQTTRGKIVVIAFAGVLLVFIVGMTVLFVILLRQLPAQPQAPESKPTGTTEAKKPTEQKQIPEETTTPLSEQSPAPETFEVYEYKDPFKPLITPASATAPGTTTGITSTTTTTTSTNGTVTTASSPLSLLDILTEGSVKYASIKYGGVVYKVKEGERVGSSSYQVVSIGTGSVTLLYGDDRVVLEIGEQIIK